MTHRPTVTDVLPLVRALYASEQGVCGCCLHIVLDDGNLEFECKWFCWEQATQMKHKNCERLAVLLLQMTPTQLRKIRAIQ